MNHPPLPGLMHLYLYTCGWRECYLCIVLHQFSSFYQYFVFFTKPIHLINSIVLLQLSLRTIPLTFLDTTPVPLWVIIVSVVVGSLFLVILIFILYKVSFSYQLLSTPPPPHAVLCLIYDICCTLRDQIHWTLWLPGKKVATDNLADYRHTPLQIMSPASLTPHPPPPPHPTTPTTHPPIPSSIFTL